MPASSATIVRPSAELVRERYIGIMADAYASSDATGKRAIRAALTSRMDEALRKSDMAAFAWKAAVDGLASAKATAKIEIDPLAVITTRVRQLVYAAVNLANGYVTPEGLTLDESGEKSDLSEALATLAERIIDACETTSGFALPLSDDADWVAAKKLAATKLTRSTERNSIADVVARAIEGKPAGTFMAVSQVRTEGSTDDYRPSDGAVAAHLFGNKADSPVRTHERYVVMQATATQPRGIIVSAVEEDDAE
jgi:hypothetical protein